MTIQVTVTSEVKRGELLFREETWTMDGNPATKMYSSYNLAGDYVGDRIEGEYLADKGIVPEKRKPTSNICSIGFSHKDQKWYGWSHRAMHGFGIGDVAEEGDCVCSKSLDPESDVSVPVGFVAKTLDDAKRMAIAFADCVS